MTLIGIERKVYLMMKSYIAGLTGFLAVLCCLALPQHANATSVVQLNESQLVEFSTFVVRGKVVSKRSIPGPRGMGIVTLVTIEVAEEMVGRSKPKRIVVRHFGGQIGSRKVSMPGGPSFKIGNEVVVFVQKSKYLPKGEYLLVGLTQGKFIVVRSKDKVQFAKGSKAILVRNLRDLKRFDRNGVQVIKPMPNQISLNTMRIRLRKIYKQIQIRRQKKLLKLPKVKKALPKIKIPHLKPQGIRVPMKKVTPKLIKPKPQGK